MKYVFISDLHIKTSNDDAAKFFEKFCLAPEVQSADKIVFLGDIFDLLIGEHHEYTQKFSFFFKNVSDFLDAGKEVVFIEGNHDFHFEKVFNSYLSKNCKFPEKFSYLKKGKFFEYEKKRYYYCHGYEVDYFNKYFKRWYRIYSSSFFKFFVNWILNFGLIQKLGDWASKDSKRRGKKSFDFDQMKQKYIDGSKALIDELQVTGVICGHTHIPEFKFFDDERFYLNIGFPVRDKLFAYFNNGEISTVKLL